MPSASNTKFAHSRVWQIHLHLRSLSHITDLIPEKELCIFDKLLMYNSRKQIVHIWQVIYVKYKETITPTTQIRRMAGASAASEAMLVNTI